MGLRHAAARFLVSSLPTDTGLWRLRAILPGCPDPERLMTTTLRGYPLRLNFKPATYMGWFLYYRGMYEEQPVRVCAGLLREGTTFVDVGANYGLYTVIAAARVGPRGRVVSVEPQPELRAIIADNLAINLLGNAVVMPYALGSSQGNASLHHPSRTNDGAATLQLCKFEQSFGEPVPVVVRTLSAVLEECQISTVEGVKIDVEGAELEVLRGSIDLLRKAQPEFLLLECIDRHLHRFGATSEQLYSFLWEFGYRTACLYRGRWRSIVSYSDYADCHGSPDLLAVHPSTATWEAARDLFASSRLRTAPGLIARVPASQR